MHGSMHAVVRGWVESVLWDRSLKSAAPTVRAQTSASVSNSISAIGKSGSIVARMRLNDRVLVGGFLNVLDLVGTFVFAVSGAVSGVKHRIDLFGVLVLSFVAATAGGIIRDVLI